MALTSVAARRLALPSCRRLKALSSRFSDSGCPGSEGIRLSGERVITRVDSFQSTSPSSPLGRTPHARAAEARASNIGPRNKAAMLPNAESSIAPPRYDHHYTRPLGACWDSQAPHDPVGGSFDLEGLPFQASQGFTPIGWRRAFPESRLLDIEVPVLGA